MHKNTTGNPAFRTGLLSYMAFRISVHAEWHIVWGEIGRQTVLRLLTSPVEIEYNTANRTSHTSHQAAGKTIRMKLCNASCALQNGSVSIEIRLPVDVPKGRAFLYTALSPSHTKWHIVWGEIRRQKVKSSLTAFFIPANIIADRTPYTIPFNSRAAARQLSLAR